MANKTCIVLLISDQTIPNVMFLKWYFKEPLGRYDVLFLSTKAMEDKEKSKCIADAVDYLKKFISMPHTKIVDENNTLQIRQSLEQFFTKNLYEKIVANITGGTKLMSLALYEYCKSVQTSDVEIFYQPIGKELLMLHPENKKNSISDLLTLDEWMRACGVYYKTNKSLQHEDFEFNKKIHREIFEKNKEIIIKMIDLQNTSYFKNVFKRKPVLDMTQVDESKFELPDKTVLDKQAVLSLIKDFQFDATQFTRVQMANITGGWFEEYVYQKLKYEKHIAEENIALNVEIKKGNDNNELDVVYVDAQNQLHIVECKTVAKSDLLNDTLYKQQAIKSKFGLTVKSHLYINDTVAKDSHLNRAKAFDIEIVDREKLLEKE